MDMLKSHRTILIIGKRGTGKSTLLKDILYHIRKQIDFAIAICGTLDTVDMFEQCLPTSNIYNEYNIEIVRNVLNCTRLLSEQNKTRHILLALDDCMYDKSVMKSKEMREIHMNGRHHNLWFINSVQYLMDIGPELRTNIDYVFCLKENIIANRKKIHQYFFGVFNTYEEFSFVFDKCTENYECLVLDNTLQSNKVDDCVFHYKANPHINKFRLGKRIYFKLDHYFRKDSERHTTGNNSVPPILDPISIKKKKIEFIEKIDHEEE
jgi:energy-coupling factor transporter ATP-binding protein EcfA2